MLIAIVDIGSNSVRLVFYDYASGYPQPVFNEKVTCTLGEGLESGGHLPEHAKENVRRTIARYGLLIRARRPDMVKVLATAAIRESMDGSAFAEELSDIIGYPITILSGAEESLYAAYGVAATTWQPQGIVVDMGGGSVDIASIKDDGTCTPIISIPHGALYFTTYHQNHGTALLKTHLTKLFKSLKKHPARTLYAVGGSFRAVASHHMARTHYPLHIIHDYTLSQKEIAALHAQILEDTHNNIPLADVPKRRVPALIPTTLLLQTLMQTSSATECVFSSAGIREGALSVAMELHTSHYDPLLAMMQSLHSILTDDAYIHALSVWITQLLPLSAAMTRIVHAFCYISEIAAPMHPDYRAEYAYERVIATQGYGLTHREQVILALAAYFRYRSKLKLKHPTLSLLNDQDKHLAYAMGRLADIAYSVSGGSADMLQHFAMHYHAPSKKLTLQNITPHYHLPDELTTLSEQLSQSISALHESSRLLHAQ
jgi:exopolyphosphatase/guanosine-5'-triphosphate,3'-diphosphate pyrophosphatase